MIIRASVVLANGLKISGRSSNGVFAAAVECGNALAATGNKALCDAPLTGNAIFEVVVPGDRTTPTRYIPVAARTVRRAFGK